MNENVIRVRVFSLEKLLSALSVSDRVGNAPNQHQQLEATPLVSSLPPPSSPPPSLPPQSSALPPLSPSPSKQLSTVLLHVTNTTVINTWVISSAIIRSVIHHNPTISPATNNITTATVADADRYYRHYQQ